MIKKFLKNFDINRFTLVFEVIFILAVIVFVFNITDKAYSRYESDVDVSAEAKVAFFVIDQGTQESSISLSGITPSLDPFYYKFYVQNFNNEGRANVTLDYTIKFETTTNLPLMYEVVRNESFNPGYRNIITSERTRTDENGVFYRVFDCNGTRTFTHNSNHIDEYTLKVIFPESYKNSPDAYQGAVELFSIIIDATQVA